MSVTDYPPTLTEHVLLVPFVRFAHQIGLVEVLDRVPIKVMTLEHSPGDKPAKLLLHILTGGMHVNEWTLATSTSRT